jgi:hypothetical protein
MSNKREGSRVIIDFANNNQAKVFFNWFKEYGYDELINSDSVNDDLSSEEFYNCISADELPGNMSDEEAYWIEIE